MQLESKPLYAKEETKRGVGHKQIILSAYGPWMSGSEQNDHRVGFMDPLVE
jgi:hypothetical protein